MRVRIFGSEISATIVEMLPNGDSIMVSQEHNGRLSIGTRFRATPREIISYDETPSDSLASLAKLQAAMEEERKTLPSVQSLLDAAKAK